MLNKGGTQFRKLQCPLRQEFVRKPIGKTKHNAFRKLQKNNNNLAVACKTRNIIEKLKRYIEETGWKGTCKLYFKSQCISWGLQRKQNQLSICIYIDININILIDMNQRDLRYWLNVVMGAGKSEFCRASWQADSEELIFQSSV